MNYEPIYIWEIHIPIKQEYKFWQACYLLGWSENDNFFFSDYTYLAKGLVPSLYACFTYDATEIECLALRQTLHELCCEADGYILDELQEDDYDEK